MTVDWFLVDAPHVVPLEFEAWESAKEHQRRVFLRCLEAKAGSAARSALLAEGQVLKIEADRLEQIAREAWKQKLRMQS